MKENYILFYLIQNLKQELIDNEELSLHEEVKDFKIINENDFEDFNDVLNFLDEENLVEPADNIVNNLINFAKSYEVFHLDSIGDTEIILN